jgi:hypothetical protein
VARQNNNNNNKNIIIIIIIIIIIHTVPTIWRVSRPHYIWKPHTGKRTIHKIDMIACVLGCSLTYARKQGKIRQWTLVWTCTKISRNKSWRWGNHIM